jgi:uncharacterized protein YjbI with pentapeptide repeats
MARRSGNLGDERLRQIWEWVDSPKNRPFVLLATVLVTAAALLVFDAVTSFRLFPDLLNPAAQPDWSDQKDQFQIAIILLGLPVAFWLWHWRDRNVRDQIEEQRRQVENQRQDTNLKEFQEVVWAAAGVIDSSHTEGRETLQIASLHQMRGFLRGDFGPTFKRSAFETYCSILARPMCHEDDDVEQPSNALSPYVYDAIRDIVFEEWQAFFWQDYANRHSWPLQGRSLREIRLPVGADLMGVDLSRIDFSGSALSDVDFSDTRSWDTNFSQCNLRCSKFNRASCEGAKFDASDFAGAVAHDIDMMETSLSGTKFHGADFSNGNFYKASGSNSCFINANLERGNFNDVRLYGVEFENAKLAHATFVSAIIHGNAARGADISECDFSYAKIQTFYPNLVKSCDGVKINGKTILPHPKMLFGKDLLSSEKDEVAAIWIENGAVVNNADDNFCDKLADDERIKKMRSLSEIFNATKPV